MTLGQRISLYRKKLHISQEELGARLGVSRQAVSKWETGEATPDAERIIALAKVLGVTTDALLLGREEPAPVHPGEAARQAAPAPEWLDHLPRHIGRLFREKGYIAGYIVAAFQQAYGIDLTREKLHWFRFRALFAALPEETLMAKIMSWRTMDLSEYEGSMRAHYADLQERFALPAELRGGAARVVSVEEHDAAFLARFRH